MTKQNSQEIYSPAATKKAVLAQALQNPVTLGLSALGLLGGGAAALFNLGIPGLAVGGVGLSLGLGTFCYQYFFKSEAIASRHIEKIRKDLLEQNLAKRDQIKSDLSALLTIVDAKQYIEQALSQFDMIKVRCENLASLLGAKFTEEELAYRRYATAAEQINLSILDNLQRIVDALKSISTMDPVYIIKRTTALKKLPQLVDADKKELETLNQRHALRTQQLDRVNELLTYNEEAITVLDKTTTSIANITTGSQMAGQSIDFAMEELIELANRARAFDQSRR